MIARNAFLVSLCWLWPYHLHWVLILILLCGSLVPHCLRPDSGCYCFCSCGSVLELGYRSDNVGELELLVDYCDLLFLVVRFGSLVVLICEQRLQRRLLEQVIWIHVQGVCVHLVPLLCGVSLNQVVSWKLCRLVEWCLQFLAFYSWFKFPMCYSGVYKLS